MKRLHSTLNITFSDEYYKKFCSMKKTEQRKVLEAIPAFNHLGSKRKKKEIEKILNETPNTRTTTRKAKQDNAASSGGRNAKDTTKRPRDDKAKD